MIPLMEEEEGEPRTFVVYCSFRPPAVEVGQAVSELLSAPWMSVCVSGGLVLSLPPWVGFSTRVFKEAKHPVSLQLHLRSNALSLRQASWKNNP